MRYSRKQCSIFSERGTSSSGANCARRTTDPATCSFRNPAPTNASNGSRRRSWPNSVGKNCGSASTWTAGRDRSGGNEAAARRMDEKRGGRDRRQMQRGGRRATDLRALTPELQAEAGEYAAEIARSLGTLNAALEDNDVVSARTPGKQLKRATDALHLLLATGKS